MNFSDAATFAQLCKWSTSFTPLVGSYPQVPCILCDLPFNLEWG